MDKQSILFPHENYRDHQESMIIKVKTVLDNKQNLILNAPTGIGKTDSTLPVALSYALNNNKVVFFLTSKHTQHKIAIDSLRKIKQKYNKNIIVVDIIGKRWMCLQPGASILPPGQFLEYCRDLREKDECEYYLNLKSKGQLSIATRQALNTLTQLSPLDVENSINISSNHKLCPYEVSLLLAKDAKVVIADYYHLFNKSIRDNILNKMNRSLNDCIIIVDEAHNLPSRIRDLLSIDLSSYVMSQALKEARQLKDEKLISATETISNILERLAEKIKNGNEVIIKKIDLIREIELLGYYEDIINMFNKASDIILEEKRRSFLASISSFLSAWTGDDFGFARILSKTKSKRGYTNLTLAYHCLDPSVATKEVIQEAYSTIMMSGTLSPVNMYKDILGVDNSLTAEFQDPFPKHNRLNIIVPKTSTKFSTRSEKMYMDIANTTVNAINQIPGNVLVFFPSYDIRDRVYENLKILANKTIFLEQQGASKADRNTLLENFKSYKDSGAILLATSTGSFSEGIDLPGDFLKAVVIVGLPLATPNLETQELIRYYDEKFQKGWDYGYIMPAVIKTLQAAGRCIRSETDRGIIAFIDERYIQPSYSRCFPKDWEIKTSINPEIMIKEFFDK